MCKLHTESDVGFLVYLYLYWIKVTRLADQIFQVHLSTYELKDDSDFSKSLEYCICILCVISVSFILIYKRISVLNSKKFNKRYNVSGKIFRTFFFRLSIIFIPINSNVKLYYSFKVWWNLFISFTDCTTVFFLLSYLFAGIKLLSYLSGGHPSKHNNLFSQQRFKFN